MAGLLRRRTPEAPAEPGPALPVRPGAKGRATPRRAEARAARTKVTTPAGSGRSGASAKRNTRREEARAYRQSMRSTDPAKLPPAERLPERILARDVVDRRRNAGPLFLLAAVVYFIGGFVPLRQVEVALLGVMLVAFLVVLVDSAILSVLVSRAVAAAYPQSQARVRFYAIRRALLPKRWRQPRSRI